MRRTIHTLILLLALGALSAMFQNCSADSFNTYGNGSPHEGIDGGDHINPIIDEPIKEPVTPLPNPGNSPNNHNGHSNNNQHLVHQVEDYCYPVEGSIIAEVLFGKTTSDTNAMQIVGSDANVIAQQWNRQRGEQWVNRALNLDVHITHVVRDGEQLLVHFLVNSETIHERLQCASM